MSKNRFSLGDILRKINEEGQTSQSQQEAISPPKPDRHYLQEEKRLPQQEISLKQECSTDLPDQPLIDKKNTNNTTLQAHRDTNTNQPPSPIAATSIIKDKMVTPQPYTHTPTPIPEFPHKNQNNLALQTSFDEEQEEEQFDIHRYLSIILRRKILVITVAIIFSLISVFQYLSADKYYQSSARLLFRPDNQEMINENAMMRYYVDSEKIFNTHLELLKSKTVLKIVSDNLDMTVSPSEIFSGLTVKQGMTNEQNNDIVELSFRHFDREIARDVLNELCRTYIDYRRDVNAQELNRLIVKFDIQINKLQKDLDVREGDLREFKEENQMVQLSSETNLAVSKLSDMELALQKTQLALLASNERFVALNSQISKQEQDIINSITYQDPFQNQLSSLELQLNTLSAEYSPEHYKVKMIKQQIENLKSAALDSLTQEAASRTYIKNPIRQTLIQELINLTIEKAVLESQRTAQEHIIERLSSDLHKLPALEQKFIYLQRETESQLQTLRILKSKFEEVKIRRDSQESDLKLLEMAETPQNAISSAKLSKIIIGFIIGLMLGIGLAFLLEYLDQSIKDPAQLENILELPLLGIVPLIESDKALVEESTELTKAILEPFRALRANLKHIASAHELKTFIICSAIKGEGKTTLSANLAITFALDGKKVILIDADLRRSQMHTLFAIPKEKGFSDYLLSKATLDDIIKPTRYPNLFVITSGERPANPAELLGTIRFDMMLQELRGRADMVLFDSPALLPVSDTLTMAPKMDGCVLIVRTMYTPLKAAKQAKNQLKRIGCRLYGGIINGVSHSKGYYPYYYGYYGYYSYKYSYEDDVKETKFSIRQFGLHFESKLRSTLNSARFAVPKLTAATNSLFNYLVKRKTFWVLFVLLLSIIGIKVVLQNRPLSEPDMIEYIGVSGNLNSSADSVIDTFPDMAKPSSRVGHLTTIPHPIPAVIDTQKQSISDSISLWLKARTNKDISRYLSFYDEADFRFNGGEMSQWKEKILKGFSLSEHEIFTEKKVTLTRDWQSYAEFTVELDKISKNDTVHSRVTTIWQPGKNGWKIIREKTLYQ